MRTCRGVYSRNQFILFSCEKDKRHKIKASCSLTWVIHKQSFCHNTYSASVEILFCLSAFWFLDLDSSQTFLHQDWYDLELCHNYSVCLKSPQPYDNDIQLQGHTTYYWTDYHETWCKDAVCMGQGRTHYILDQILIRGLIQDYIWITFWRFHQFPKEQWMALDESKVRVTQQPPHFSFLSRSDNASLVSGGVASHVRRPGPLLPLLLRRLGANEQRPLCGDVPPPPAPTSWAPRGTMGSLPTTSCRSSSSSSSSSSSPSSSRINYSSCSRSNRSSTTSSSSSSSISNNRWSSTQQPQFRAPVLQPQWDAPAEAVEI